jgi:FkbM family methyltransferase
MKKSSLTDFLFYNYALLFAKKRFLNFNKLLFSLGLRGMGILNHQSNKISGEDFFLKNISKILDNSVSIDVGANIGAYSNKISNLAVNAKIYAFEPHPETFKKLEIQSSQYNYISLNLACSDIEGQLELYDYVNDKTSSSSHASLYQDVFMKIHKADSKKWSVPVTTIDDFVKKYAISQIRLLKIDTEGNELKVLLGAKQTISDRLIDIIHFEFNEMNIFSKVFFNDIKNILHEYSIYRMLPYGLLPLYKYSPLYCEIFSYQNIVAIRKDKLDLVSKYIDID